MKIAVSGAGITGTAVGFLLADQGHDVTIFEQAPECRPVGAGIMLQTSGQRVLDRLGMMNDLAEVSAKLGGMTARQASGRCLVSLDFSDLAANCCAYGVHRGTLFTRLVERCTSSGVAIENGVRIDRFDATQGAVIDDRGRAFDGFDFVIATDGSRSQLRDSCGIRAHVTRYQHAAIWTTGKCDYQPEQLVQVVQGTTKLIGLLPIGNERSSFFWGVPKRDWEALKNSDIEKWKQQVRRLCPESESILDGIDNFSQMAFGTYRNVALSKWHTEKIIFLGDAAHATSPHLGQGVNLALEDAVCFADSLAKTDDFELACREFTRIRTRKLRYYQQLTKLLSPFFQSDSVLRGLGRDIVLPWLPSLPFVGREMLRTLTGQKQGWLR